MIRHALAALLAAVPLVAAPGPARAQAGSPPPLVTGTFGNWSLSAATDVGLQIANERRPGAVRLQLAHTSNGWFLLETTAGQFIMWTAGTFSRDGFSFDEDKPDAGAPPLAAGSYSFGPWRVGVTATELHIDHDANPHTIVLARDSDGWIEVRGATTAPVIRIGPDDDPTRGTPGSGAYGP